MEGDFSNELCFCRHLLGRGCSGGMGRTSCEVLPISASINDKHSDTYFSHLSHKTHIHKLTNAHTHTHQHMKLNTISEARAIFHSAFPPLKLLFSYTRQLMLRTYSSFTWRLLTCSIPSPSFPALHHSLRNSASTPQDMYGLTVCLSPANTPWFLFIL